MCVPYETAFLLSHTYYFSTEIIGRMSSVQFMSGYLWLLFSLVIQHVILGLIFCTRFKPCSELMIIIFLHGFSSDIHHYIGQVLHKL